MGILKYFAGQFGNPRGWVGRLVGLGLARKNRPMHEWVISKMNIQPDDHILEIAFGPGVAVQIFSEKAIDGHVSGIDFSQTMLDQATRRNIRGIKSGKIDLRLGDATSLPYETDSFHKIYAANVIYFLTEPEKMITESYKTLKPGGELFIFMVRSESLTRIGMTQTGVYIPYEVDSVSQMLMDAGFSEVQKDDRSFGVLQVLNCTCISATR